MRVHATKNMSMLSKPRFYIVKMGFTARDIPIFLIFCPKRRLCILVRTAAAKGF